MCYIIMLVLLIRGLYIGSGYYILASSIFAVAGAIEYGVTKIVKLFVEEEDE